MEFQALVSLEPRRKPNLGKKKELDICNMNPATRLRIYTWKRLVKSIQELNENRLNQILRFSWNSRLLLIELSLLTYKHIDTDGKRGIAYIFLNFGKNIVFTSVACTRLKLNTI